MWRFKSCHAGFSLRALEGREARGSLAGDQIYTRHLLAKWNTSVGSSAHRRAGLSFRGDIRVAEGRLQLAMEGC